MNYYLSVDGGGTKTKFLIANENGVIIAESLQPTSYYLVCGLDGMVKIIRKGIDECVAKARINITDITYAFIAVAGYNDIPEDDDRIRDAVKGAIDPIPFSVGNDTENALMGALGGEFGINIIAGTGSIALGIDSYGNTFRCGGWHYLFGGDEGSGYWLGCQLIREFTRQCDGRDAKTKLYYYLKDHYGLITASDIVKLTVKDWEFDRTKIAALSEAVTELAKENDPYALSFFSIAAKELADLIMAVKNSLKFDSTVKVSYTGGVFKSGPFILDPLKAHLKNNDILLNAPMLQPDCGGILLAIQLSGNEITKQIIHNLKGYA